MFYACQACRGKPTTEQRRTMNQRRHLKHCHQYELMSVVQYRVLLQERGV
jgi:hypothetical protein